MPISDVQKKIAGLCKPPLDSKQKLCQLLSRRLYVQR